MCQFREACKSGAEAGKKTDKSVPAVAKTKSNFLLNGRTGFPLTQINSGQAGRVGWVEMGIYSGLQIDRTFPTHPPDKSGDIFREELCFENEK